MICARRRDGVDEAREPDRDPTVDPAVDVPADEDASHEVMSLLSEHVPLALLADLVLPDGPASPEILTEEGLPEVAWWEGGDEEGGVPEESEGAKPTV